MIIAWKGWGLLAIILLVLSYFVVKKLPVEILSQTGGGVMGVTLCVAAILITPLGVYDFINYRKNKVMQNSAFFIPLFFFPIVVLALGIVFFKT